MSDASGLTEKDIKFLFNRLRQASVIWDGRKETLDLARKKVFVRRAKNGKPVYKYHWQCASCKSWKYNKSEVEVDHIKEIGGVMAFNGDWNEVIKKMFPRPVSKHLQVLCIPCHKRKTGKFTSALAKYSRKKKLS